MIEQIQPEYLPGTVTTEDVEKIYEKKYLVILFNDDVHYVGDVINQVVKAIHCSLEVAEAIVMDVEKNGSGFVYIGDKPSCEFVCSVLEEIALICKIVKE